MTTAEMDIDRNVEWTLKHTRTGDKLTAEPIAVLVAMGFTDAEIGALCRAEIVNGIVLNTRMLHGGTSRNGVREAARKLIAADRAAKSKAK